MSHFSKIKTNISNIEILKKTIQDFGFNYELNTSFNVNKDISTMSKDKCLNVFDNKMNSNFLFKFIWDGYQYNLIADFSLWNLNMSIEYFLEKLSQQYAYNVIFNQSSINGFNKKHHILMEDGSIKIIMQKWNA